MPRVHPRKMSRIGNGFPIRRRRGKGSLEFSGHHSMQKPEKDKWTLAFLTAGKEPVLRNASAELHDIGDGIICFSLTKGKMRVIDEDALGLLAQSVEKAESEFKGMIIGHDGKHFSAGLDLRIIQKSANSCQWSRIVQVLQYGQDCFMRVKQCKVPVVAAVCGYTLGGGCELAMHCAAIQAHTYTHMGLVETDIGVIPAWGGTKESLLRAVKRGDQDAASIAQYAVEIFQQIALAKKSINADDAFSMGLLTELPVRQSSGEAGAYVTINRERLLPDAKALCLALAEDYTPQTELIIEVPVESLHQQLEQEVLAIIQNGHQRITQHHGMVLKILAKVLSGYSAVRVARQAIPEEPSRAGWDKISESMLLQTSREAFMELVQEEEALGKIRAILN